MKRTDQLKKFKKLGESDRIPEDVCQNIFERGICKDMKDCLILLEKPSTGIQSFEKLDDDDGRRHINGVIIGIKTVIFGPIYLGTRKISPSKEEENDVIRELKRIKERNKKESFGLHEFYENLPPRKIRISDTFEFLERENKRVSDFSTLNEYTLIKEAFIYRKYFELGIYQKSLLFSIARSCMKGQIFFLENQKYGFYSLGSIFHTAALCRGVLSEDELKEILKTLPLELFAYASRSRKDLLLLSLDLLCSSPLSAVKNVHPDVQPPEIRTFSRMVFREIYKVNFYLSRISYKEGKYAESMKFLVDGIENFFKLSELVLFDEIDALASHTLRLYPHNFEVLQKKQQEGREKKFSYPSPLFHYLRLFKLLRSRPALKTLTFDIRTEILLKIARLFYGTADIRKCLKLSKLAESFCHPERLRIRLAIMFDVCRCYIWLGKWEKFQKYQKRILMFKKEKIDPRLSGFHLQEMEKEEAGDLEKVWRRRRKEIEEIKSYSMFLIEKKKKISSFKNRKCYSCNSESEKMSRCASCRVVFYCSKDCQRLDWKLHRKCCVNPFKL